jgi:hypothetical protein
VTGFLQVDLDVLRNATQSMTSAVEELHAVQKIMSREGGLDIGPEVLNDAANDFQRSWHYGLGEIGKRAATAADGLRACHDAYQAADTDVAAAVRAIGRRIPETPGGGGKSEATW